MKHEKRIKDFYISCVLRALNYELLKIERNENNIATFVFEDTNNAINEVIKNYWDQKVQVDSRTLINAIHELKTRLYSKS